MTTTAPTPLTAAWAAHDLANRPAFRAPTLRQEVGNLRTGRKLFTVVTKKRVLRVKAKSIQQLTQALRSVGIVWEGIHEDAAPKKLTGRPKA